jgi:hypothetical protein
MKCSPTFLEVCEVLCGSARIRWHSSGREQWMPAGDEGGQGAVIGGAGSLSLLGVPKGHSPAVTIATSDYTASVLRRPSMAV